MTKTCVLLVSSVCDCKFDEAFDVYNLQLSVFWYLCKANIKTEIPRVNIAARTFVLSKRQKLTPWPKNSLAETGLVVQPGCRFVVCVRVLCGHFR